MRMRKPTKIERADIAVTAEAAPLRRTWPVRALGAVSEVADQPQLITACTATAAYGLLSGNERLASTGLRMLAAELVATKLKGLIKHRVDRTRPNVVDAGKRYELQPGHEHASDYNSFPSGHTAGAVGVARAIARGYPEHRLSAYSAAAAIAAIQIPRSKHYPTDLAAGAMIGLVAEGAVFAAERMIVVIVRRFRGSARSG
jgi:membrane-associated phospholipid phosphatase